MVILAATAAVYCSAVKTPPGVVMDNTLSFNAKLAALATIAVRATGVDNLVPTPLALYWASVSEVILLAKLKWATSLSVPKRAISTVVATPVIVRPAALSLPAIALV